MLLIKEMFRGLVVSGWLVFVLCFLFRIFFLAIIVCSMCALLHHLFAFQIYFLYLLAKKKKASLEIQPEFSGYQSVSFLVHSLSLSLKTFIFFCNNLLMFLLTKNLLQGLIKRRQSPGTSKACKERQLGSIYQY